MDDDNKIENLDPSVLEQAKQASVSIANAMKLDQNKKNDRNKLIQKQLAAAQLAETEERKAAEERGEVRKETKAEKTERFNTVVGIAEMNGGSFDPVLHNDRPRSTPSQEKPAVERHIAKNERSIS